jgi:beta-1,4-mannosyl-glycoprotein beta-1,4-N-acetylglucosaminyltransferase
MIIDIFPFFNELDVLELRLRVLENVVDKFIAVQAEETHSGLPKPIYFNPQDERWKQWSNRLETVILPKIPNAENRWVRENAPREAIPHIIKDVPNDEVILMSDVDEIPDPHLVKDYSKIVRHHKWVGFSTACHYYYLNLRTQRPHRCIMLVQAQRMRENGGQYFRDRHHKPRVGPIKGGWHFSYLGGIDAIITKLSSFAHSEFDIESIKNSKYLASCISQKRSFFPKHFHANHEGQFYQVPLTELPIEIQNHPERYAKHLLPYEDN